MSLLLDELTLAQKYNAPLICIGLYPSESTRKQALSLLKRRLQKVGLQVCSIQVDEQEYDIPRLLQKHPNLTDTIFSVYGLKSGGSKQAIRPYQALNVHREFLVEQNIRCIVWMTEKTYRRLLRLAPDFWAFRHHVVDLLDLPSQSG
ncbi:MAG: hypothetical protein N2049_11100 [Anaerolineales bacterium]|nr:hypothetical protein [Anaerolineales bacterium]MCX7609744.1 hypothetical protein [Anaerolineales bacterium]